ncbi:MAG: hypothetical protein SO412_04395 [Erysipelotrichaceae bacterium]|nr:hypothetical protein [Erysipelotrichaceae bacterium]
MSKKGRTYLSIVDSFYNPETKDTAYETYRSLGSVETLKAKGMEDPVAYYEKEVERLNEEKESEDAKRLVIKLLLNMVVILLLNP